MNDGARPRLRVRCQNLLLTACCTLLAGGAAAAEAQGTAPGSRDPAGPDFSTVLDEVLVTGEQPGPGLWKVSRGDHVLWILGTYGPLPKKMSWRSAQVESVIAKSQELLTSVDIKPNIGLFTGLSLLPSLIGLRNNPHDAKLSEVVPPDLYARWRVLKERYIGNDNSVEKWRPIFAARELYARAIDKAGMQTGDVVWPVVDKLARKNDLKRIKPAIELTIDKPRAAIKEFKKSPLDDLDCFAKTIERLETDLDLMRARANAWSVGNVAELRRMTHVDQASACIAAVMNTEIARQRGIQSVPGRIAAAWIAAAESALARNAATFAVLRMDEILSADGYVATLRARGYMVEAP